MNSAQVRTGFVAEHMTWARLANNIKITGSRTVRSVTAKPGEGRFSTWPNAPMGGTATVMWGTIHRAKTGPARTAAGTPTMSEKRMVLPMSVGPTELWKVLIAVS